jgi:1A family penicillin-binding protein
LSFGIILLGIFFIWIATMQVPNIASFQDRKISSSTKIMDRTGKVVLYDVHENIRRTVVNGDAISPLIKNAIISIEDKNFYHHHGIIPKSIFRAMLSQIIPTMERSGGSTITQQLVKNTLLTQERSITRKVKEWVLAVKLEKIMSKDDILTTYLNEAPYGGPIYGVEEASQNFFGKPARDVTLGEAAYLAAIPNAPSYYSPYGKNVDRLEDRKNLILKNMLEQGYISEKEYDTAKTTPITFKTQKENHGKAIHFIEYIRSYLEEKYGTDKVLNGGLRVITTLDWDLQQVAEKAIYENALKNEKDYGATNSALVAIDPKTGGILSMVGSRDYFDTKIDGAYNIATAQRQPGSSFKPIVYARAFEKGYLPETVLFDIPTQFGSCGAFDRSSTPPCYAPDNYDNKFTGPISLRNALAQSRNIPAVQLLSMIGLPDALATAKKLGLTTLDRDGSRYGLTLVLGGGEVSLLDMTSVYSVFANDGVRNPVTGILEVIDGDGVTLEKITPKPETVMDANATRNLSSVLSDNVARTPLFGANSFFYFLDRQVAGKTGTTNSNKDAWVFGYTPSIAVGVWSGNNDNTPMKKGSSISGAAWKTFMNAALEKLPYDKPGIHEGFVPASLPVNYTSLAPVLRGSWAGGESFFIDTVSQKLATDLTPPETRKEVVIPNPHNITHWITPSDPTGPRPSRPENFGHYTKWEAEFQSWIANHPGIVPGFPTKPTGYDDVHTETSRPQISFSSDIEGKTYSSQNPLSISLIVQSAQPLKSIDWYLNNILINSGTDTTFTFIPNTQQINPGNNELKAVVTDALYNRNEVVTHVQFQ